MIQQQLVNLISEKYSVPGDASDLRVGRILSFEYTNFQHDPIPLALLLKFEQDYKTFQSVNFHYLHPNVRLAFVHHLEKAGLINKYGSIKLDVNVLHTLLSDISICIRRYKENYINNMRPVRLVDFVTHLWQDKGKADSMFLKQMHDKSLISFKMKGLL